MSKKPSESEKPTPVAVLEELARMAKQIESLQNAVCHLGTKIKNIERELSGIDPFGPAKIGSA